MRCPTRSNHSLFAGIIALIVRSIGRLLFVPILSNPASFGTNSGLFGTNFGTNFPVLLRRRPEHQETVAEMPIRRSGTRSTASNYRGDGTPRFRAASDQYQRRSAHRIEPASPVGPRHGPAASSRAWRTRSPIWFRAATGDLADRPALQRSPLGRASRHQRASAGTASPRAEGRRRKETAANLRPPAMPAAECWCGHPEPVPSETPSAGRGDKRDLALLARPGRSNREGAGSRHGSSTLTPEADAMTPTRTQVPKRASTVSNWRLIQSSPAQVGASAGQIVP